MRSLRKTMVAGVSALAIGATVALASPAVSAVTADDSPRDLGTGSEQVQTGTPAALVPEGATIIDGGVVEWSPGDSTGAALAQPVPEGAAIVDGGVVTPAQPVPEGATIIDGGVVEWSPGDSTGAAPAQPAPAGATLTEEGPQVGAG